MLVLVDTSIWIDHFRIGEKQLVELLKLNQVSTHEIIIGELTTGNLPNRNQTLNDLTRLPKVSEALFDEVFSLLETNNFYGKGLQWNDLHILASAKISNVELWTRDKCLQQAAKKLKCEYIFKKKGE